MSIYKIVPDTILKRELRFIVCIMAISIQADISDSPYGELTNDISFRQYINNIPMIAYGNTLPR